jgi:hypothetical protein
MIRLVPDPVVVASAGPLPSATLHETAVPFRHECLNIFNDRMVGERCQGLLVVIGCPTRPALASLDESHTAPMPNPSRSRSFSQPRGEHHPHSKLENKNRSPRRNCRGHFFIRSCALPRCLMQSMAQHGEARDESSRLNRSFTIRMILRPRWRPVLGFH